MKRRNPKFGYLRIAQQISFVFDVALDKDVVRRVLAKHYRPPLGAEGPSWLRFLARCKDRLWSVVLFRCESITTSSAFTARSVARHQPNVPAHPRLPVLNSIISAGGSIVTAYFRSRSPLD